MFLPLDFESQLLFSFVGLFEIGSLVAKASHDLEFLTFWPPLNAGILGM